MEQPIENPYKKGKSKLIAGLMLEGWNNEKIYNHISQNKLDERFSSPITMEMIYKVRTKFNQSGLTDRLMERAQRKVLEEKKEFQEESLEPHFSRVSYDSQQQKDVADIEEKTSGRFPPKGRPEWDLLTMEQINSIEDPQLRTTILEHRSYREKIKQEVTSDYATSEQFDGFKKEIQSNLLDIDGRLNDLKESISETIVETFNKMKASNPQNPETTLADLDDVAEFTDPSMDLETENPLEATTDSVIELEGSIISRKTVGFTPKSLMLYDLTRKKGFRGNFADFVNSCISSAMKGRKFKLTVEEDVE